MPDKEDRYLLEARDLISTGNKTFTLIFISALIWWLANLFPYNLSERTTRSLAGRLDTLAALGSDADSICSKAIDSYAAVRVDVILRAGDALEKPEQVCIAKLAPPSSLAVDLLLIGPGVPEDQKKRYQVSLRPRTNAAVQQIWGNGNIKQRLTAISAELRKGTPEACGVVLEQKFFRECLSARSAFVAFVDDWTKEGNVDVVGLKISNINVRWHPIALVAIILSGVIWLGLQRRRIFYLINMHFASSDNPDREVWLLKVPWWLLPIPDTEYKNGLPLRKFVAPQAEYKCARITAAVLLLIVLAMVASAILAQRLLSMNAELHPLSPDLQELGNFEHASLGLFGSVVFDVLCLSALVFIPAAIMWWAIPAPGARMRRARHGALAARRQALTAIASATLVSLAIPLVAKPDALNALYKRYARSKPHQKRKHRLAVYSGRPGWYWNVSSSPDVSTIGHFVKPEFNFVRAVKGWSLRRPKQIHHQAGRISGVGKIQFKQLVEMEPGEIVPFDQNSRHLDTRHYSEGIEQAAVQQWSNGSRDEAVRILQAGLTYTANGADLNIRLYDLLAGLVVRSGRDRELAPLIEKVQAKINEIDAALDDLSLKINSDANSFKLTQLLKSKKRRHRWRAKQRLKARQRQVRLKAALQKRLDAWSASDGKWKLKWRSQSGCKWNGLDI